jgi:hypothetical protein
MHKPLALALALALTLPAAGADADARARAVAPFLDEQTFAVARLDLTKFDADTLATTLTDLGGAGADEARDVKESAGHWLGAFRKAGGKDLYVVFSLADFPKVYFAVVPLGEGADAKALADLLDLGVLPPGPREKIGDAVFAGTAATRQRLQSLKPAARPELAQAFAAAGDGAAQVALIPPPHLVRVIEEMMPALPKEVGDGSSKALVRGVKWAAVGLDAPPKTALRLTMQSQDAAAARALDEALGKVLKGVASLKEVRAAVPELPKTLPLLEPRVEGDRVVLSLDGQGLRGVLAPLVRRAVEEVVRVQATEDLQQLAIGMHAYVDNNSGKLPAVANFDKAGKPLLSWRVHILPYIGQEKLYKEFHLDEPWDSEHNKKLIEKMPAAFRGPSHKLSVQGKTVYLAPVGKDTAFTGTSGRRMPQEFTDGTSNTILLVQADDAHAVEWTRPEDLKIDLDKPDAGLGRRAGGYMVALADGSARLVRRTISKETLRNAFTANDGQTLGADW